MRKKKLHRKFFPGCIIWLVENTEEEKLSFLLMHWRLETGCWEWYRSTPTASKISQGLD